VKSAVAPLAPLRFAIIGRHCFPAKFHP